MQSTVLPEIPVEEAHSFARVGGAAYMVSVSIRVGSTTISLPPDFFKDVDIHKELKDNGVSSKETLPLFEVFVPDGEHPLPKRKTKTQNKFSLAMAGTQLSNRLDPIQKEFMLSSGNGRWWFFPESKYDEVSMRLDTLEEGEFDEDGKLVKPGRQQLLVELKRLAPQAKELLETRLTNILGAAGKLEFLPGYVEKFPSDDELEENFRLEIEGPIRVPGVAEMADQTPEYQQFLQQVRQQMQRDFPEWLSKTATSIATFLTRWQGCDPEKLNDKQAGLLNEAYARLEVDAELHDSMGFIDIHPARKLLDDCLALTHEACPDVATLNAKLAALKDDLCASEWVTEPQTKGTRELARWVGVETLEDRIKAFTQEVKTVAALDDGQAKTEALQALQVQARSFGGILLTTANYLLEQVGLAPDQLQHDMQTMPATVDAPTDTFETVEDIDTDPTVDAALDVALDSLDATLETVMETTPSTKPVPASFPSLDDEPIHVPATSIVEQAGF